MVAITLMKTVSAQFQVCGPRGDLTMCLLDIYLPCFPGQCCQREPNLRDQVDPTEKYCPSKASKNTKGPWCSEMSFLQGL